jgi:uncharacterized membrane protein
MGEQKTAADRVGNFTDNVIAVIITIMVLGLKAPEYLNFAALLPLWPTTISYAVSYLFVAIIWLNHHHLLRFVEHTTPALIWVNFAHLFAVSLVPFATVWIARTELAAVPVAFYAGVFVCVNLAYLVFVRQVLNQTDGTRIPEQVRRLTRRRSSATLVIFASAIIVSLFAPRAGFGLICCALLPYLIPEVPGAWLRGSKPYLAGNRRT